MSRLSLFKSLELLDIYVSCKIMNRLTHQPFGSLHVLQTDNVGGGGGGGEVLAKFGNFGLSEHFFI